MPVPCCGLVSKCNFITSHSKLKLSGNQYLRQARCKGCAQSFCIYVIPEICTRRGGFKACQAACLSKSHLQPASHHMRRASIQRGAVVGDWWAQHQRPNKQKSRIFTNIPALSACSQTGHRESSICPTGTGLLAPSTCVLHCQGNLADVHPNANAHNCTAPPGNCLRT